jgi:hypothetical protein
MQLKNWYYVQDGEPKGPLQQFEFESLVSAGTIEAGTLVWQAGMADWQPYAEMAAPAQATAPLVATPRVALSLAGVACSRCGQTVPADQVVHIGGVAVCANCKPLALQSLQEGVLHHEPSAEQLRKVHLSHEAHVKSVGSLYLAAGGLFAMGLICLALLPPDSSSPIGG